MKKQIVSLLLALILTLQLGITVFADGTETPIVPANENAEIKGLSLVLSGEIGLTFHVKLDRAYRKGAKIELKLKNKNDKDSIILNINDCPPDGDNYYMATYNLSAIELSEPVLITVFDSGNNKLVEDSYSAEYYVICLMEDENATKEEKNIGKKLINYGHYAQLACSATNGWVIGEDFAETIAFNEPIVDTSVFDNYKIKWQNRTEAFNRFSLSLQLDYKTGIHLYFPLTEKPSVTVKSKSMESAKTVEAVESERLENYYEIYIEGINALNLEEEYEITVNDVTFTLSAFSYCYLSVSHNNSGNTVDAMRALYEFHQAIVDYNTTSEA